MNEHLHCKIWIQKELEFETIYKNLLTEQYTIFTLMKCNFTQTFEPL